MNPLTTKIMETNNGCQAGAVHLCAAAGKVNLKASKAPPWGAEEFDFAPTLLPQSHHPASQYSSSYTVSQILF